MTAVSDIEAKISDEVTFSSEIVLRSVYYYMHTAYGISAWCLL